MSAKPLIIYHDNCVDGFAAAWIMYKYYGGNVELYPTSYGKEPPYELAKARNVYIVDFSYPRADLIELKANTATLQVFDHHKSAQGELDGLGYTYFDMERSGAGITWDEMFHNDVQRPLFIDYIEDRDLWRFKLPASKVVNAYITTVPRTIEAYDRLYSAEPDELQILGAGAVAWLNYYVDATVQLGQVKGLFDTFVWCVNCSPVGVSDVCNSAIDTGYSVALGWYLRDDGKLGCSLRSIKEVDVSAIAKHYGGGGHAQAAGFVTPVNSPLARVLLGMEEP